MIPQAFGFYNNCGCGHLSVMRRGLKALLGPWATPAIFLFLILFLAGGEGETFASFGIVRSVVRDSEATVRDPRTQWLIAVNLLVCLSVSLIAEWLCSARALKKRRHSADLVLGWCGHEELWILALVVMVFGRYITAYRIAIASTALLVLLAGIVFGKFAVIWVRWGAEPINENRKTRGMLASLECLLASVVFYRADFVRTFDYHAIRRWNGLWENPNIYGLLMGVGLVSAVGLGIENLKFQISPAFIGAPRQQDGKWRKISIALLCSIPAILCGIGLLKSYSRGAWMATALGSGYLIFQLSKTASVLSPRSSSLSRWALWIQRYWRITGVIGISLTVLAFSQFRSTEWKPARRAFSIANIDDFSCRNRVVAWKGALRMMADRSWFGFGWGQAEETYGKQYLPPQLESGAAIQMNDYFMLGISTGVPALICFLMYVGLSLRSPKSTVHSPQLTRGPDSGSGANDLKDLDSLQATCRAGAIVLLVGFFFDGGLFKLATGSVFWILLELGRMDIYRRGAETQRVARTNSERLVGSLAPPDASFNLPDAPRKSTRWEVWLRRGAWVLGIVAVSESAILLSTPLFSVNNTTLAISRHYLVPPSAVADLNRLATNVDWSSRKLRPLLQHTSLANYNRQIINWKLDEQIYRDYVLNPLVDPERDGQLGWRRKLWEYFYLPIRKENDPASAAQIVLKFLHQRISLVETGPVTVEEMWEQKKADAKGFEALKVAAFRSVGIPARLNNDGYAELFTDGKWQISSPEH
jgi:O-antigen ligase/polysaccharide polymerase Wzy-like membrane protein/transglutaminase superfamily protein